MSGPAIPGVDRAGLRVLAEGATPGPWKYGAVDDVAGGSLYGQGWMLGSMHWENDLPRQSGSPVLDSDFRTPEVADANGRFIAAANPETVLGLLDTIEALTAENARLRVLAEGATR